MDFVFSQKQQLQIGAAGGARGGELADESERFFIVAFSAGSSAAVRRNERGTQIGDEQRGLAIGGEFFQAGHDFGAGEEWRRRGERK